MLRWINLKPQLIAIDGPVAVGKSSVGLLLASRLGYVFFDTGIMYRAFTWKALKVGISPEDKDQLCLLASITRFDFIPSEEGCLSILVDGDNVSGKFFSPKIEKSVSIISRVAGVRQAMVAEQRKLAQRSKVVMAGRDIGTVVLPWAELKVFLAASTQERANRRYKELLEQKKNTSLEIVLAELRERDDMDIHRITSPLKPAADAVIVNTENLSLNQVVDNIYSLVVELDNQRSFTRGPKWEQGQ